MNQVESLERKVADMLAEAARLRDRADMLDLSAGELGEALRIVKLHVDSLKPQEAEAPAMAAAPTELEFKLEPLARKLTQKEMVRAAAPKSENEAVGPKELTNLVNRMFNTKFKANHVRPIIWKMGSLGEAQVKEGRYWIPEHDL